MNKSTRMFVVGVAVGVIAHYAYTNYATPVAAPRAAAR